VWVRVVVVILEICQQSLGRGIQKILVKKALSETSKAEILVPNGNWPVNRGHATPCEDHKQTQGNK
jgi:hypothetical protein